jgi:CRISPR-associated protein (TIGR03984 family)
MNKPICKKIDDLDQVESDLRGWLKAKAEEFELKYLLAHADDGVIWGKFENLKLTTSGDDDVFPQFTKLRTCTLQQCRIFGKNADDDNGDGNAEVMLWKVDKTWKARLINDQNLSDQDYIPEAQILWGTQAEAENNGFTLVSDGSQGLKHAVPLTEINFKGKDYRPLRLKVRHYIDYDQSDVARIYLSRLVDLESVKIESEKLRKKL